MKKFIWKQINQWISEKNETNELMNEYMKEWLNATEITYNLGM